MRKGRFVEHVPRTVWGRECSSQFALGGGE
jgi:hypothetical protein